MESECCEVVLNAVFYWEPVEFFQKRCDMITLRIFQDKPCGVVLDLLFIGYTCESSIVSSLKVHKLALHLIRVKIKANASLVKM